MLTDNDESILMRMRRTQRPTRIARGFQVPPWGPSQGQAGADRRQAGAEAGRHISTYIYIYIERDIYIYICVERWVTGSSGPWRCGWRRRRACPGPGGERQESLTLALWTLTILALARLLLFRAAIPQTGNPPGNQPLELLDWENRCRAADRTAMESARENLRRRGRRPESEQPGWNRHVVATFFATFDGFLR